MAKKKTVKRKIAGRNSPSKKAKITAKVVKKTKKPLPKKAAKKKAGTKPKSAPKKKVLPASKKAKSRSNKKVSPAPKKNKKTGKNKKVIVKVRAGGKSGAKGKKPNQIKKSVKSKSGNVPKEAPKSIKPLDPIFAKIRQNLLASRNDLFKMVESSQELERNVGDLTFSNEIDLASNLEGREMVFQLASRDRNGLKLIDDALFKMSRGTYGACEGCTKPIGMKRLQILPLTQFCIDCQALMENVT